MYEYLHEVQFCRKLLDHLQAAKNMPSLTHKIKFLLDFMCSNIVFISIFLQKNHLTDYYIGAFIKVYNVIKTST